MPWHKKTALTSDTSETAGNSTTGASSGQMKKFANYSELKTFLESKIVSASAASGTAPLRAAGEEGTDLLKIDGQYLYALVYNDLYIIKAVPGEEAQTLAKITFNSRPTGIHLDNGRLVVIGADSQIMEADVYKSFRRQSPYTFVKIFDLSNPQAPKQIRDLDFEGTYVGSRVIDGKLQLAIDNYDRYIAGETVLPRLVDNGQILSNDCVANSNCFSPVVYYFDLPYASFHLVSLNTLNLRDQAASVSAQAYLLSADQSVYLSAQNFFIAYAQTPDAAALRLAALRERLNDKLGTAEKERVAKIEATDNVVLNVAEKDQKLLQLFQNFLETRSATEQDSLKKDLNQSLQQKYEADFKDQERTIIYKLSLSGDQPIYRAEGFLAGTIFDPSALAEDVVGNLRAVTIRHSGFDYTAGLKDPSAGLYVLSADLKALGTAENIAAGEAIDTVHWLGQRAYLSSSRQIDTLFAVNLSDSANPKLLGTLKLPAAASALYFDDENTLIGLSKEATASSTAPLVGLTLSLFEVSDIANPRVLDTYAVGSTGSDSPALFDSKSLLLSREKDLLAWPVSLIKAGDFRPYFSGDLIFSFNSGKLALRAQIDHSDGGKYQHPDFLSNGVYYDNSVQRSFYLQEALYTFSNKYLKINGLSDFSPIKAIKLLPDTAADAVVSTITTSTAATASSSPETAETKPVGPELPATSETTASSLGEAATGTASTTVSNQGNSPAAP